MLCIQLDQFYTYRLAENVGGRKHWRIWRIDDQSPKFSPSNLWNIQCGEALFSRIWNNGIVKERLSLITVFHYRRLRMLHCVIYTGFQWYRSVFKR